MKKLALFLAFAMLFTSILLTGCVNEKTPSGTPDNAESGVPADESLLAYNAALETKLEEYQAKEDLDKEILLTVNGLPVSASSVRYANMASHASYYGSDIPEEDIKKEIEAYYKQNAALVSLAKELGIEFTQDEYTSNVKAYIASMELQYGDTYDKVFADSPFTKYFYYLYYTIYSPLFSKITEVYTKDTESDRAKLLREDALKYLEENEYVRAKHILIQFPEGEGENGELTDAQKTATLEKANAVLAEVKAMTDIGEFDALIEKYNEDPGMKSNPDGYYFTKGEMVEPFENSAYSLKEGETSGLVETTYGYHILLKLPLDDENLVNSSAYSDFVSNYVNDYLYELGDTYEIEYADNYEERVADFIAEYESLAAEDTAE